MPLNPFILKAKRALLEGFSIGDHVKITWIFQNFSNPIEMSAHGKIVEMDDWIMLLGEERTHLPITALTSVKEI